MDVGAESTRPGATPLSAEEEWSRLEKILQRLIKKYPGKISLDTYHPSTAAKALKLGDVIINDITGLSDPKMVELITTHKARCVVSHLPAATPQAAHSGKLVDDVRQVADDLLNKAAELEEKGLPKANIILDPGIGFGKTPELNRQAVGVRQRSAGLPGDDRLFAQTFPGRTTHGAGNQPGSRPHSYKGRALPTCASTTSPAIASSFSGCYTSTHVKRPGHAKPVIRIWCR